MIYLGADPVVEMNLLSLFALAGAMFVLAATPGPGVFATLARALASGFGHASILVLGIVTGDLIFLLLAVYGLAAIADLLGGFFTGVRYLGAAYLIWLGVRIWRSNPAAVAVEGVSELSWHANYLSGLVITLGNPKVILFYLGFLPTFLDLQVLTVVDVVLVALVVSAVLGGVLLGYAYAAQRARILLRSPAASRRMNRIAGGVMIGTGGVLLARS